MTGSRNSLFAKSYIKSSLKVRKERVISEFSMRVFFSVCSSVHIEFSSEKFAGSISLKLSQKLCSKSENENKRQIFQEKVAESVLSGHIDCSSELYQKSFNRIEKNKEHFKIRFSSKLFPSTPRKRMWQLCPVFFAQSPNLVKTWKLFHSNYLVLKVFHWRWWMLTWQSSQYRLKLR